MQSYKNQGRDTGVIAYQISDEGIYVEFRDNSVYLYTAESTGVAAIEKMKDLAKKGKGLTTYINRYVRNKYERKIK
jgi:hypothetical protein